MRRLLPWVVVLAVSGCIDLEEEPAPTAPTSRTPTRTTDASPTATGATLTSTSPAPSSPTEHEGRTLTLEPYLYRDFMPGVGASPDGRPLIAIITIWAEGDEAFPSDVVPDRLRVRLGDETWDTPFSSETLQADKANQTKRVAREGPKWGPDVQVDVEVRLSFPDSQTRWLVARNVTIERTT